MHDPFQTKEESILNQSSHVNRARLTCGTNAFIPVDLKHRVRKPNGRLTGWVSHTSQKLTAEGDTEQVG